MPTLQYFIRQIIIDLKNKGLIDTLSLTDSEIEKDMIYRINKQTLSKPIDYLEKRMISYKTCTHIPFRRVYESSTLKFQEKIDSYILNT